MKTRCIIKKCCLLCTALSMSVTVSASVPVTDMPNNENLLSQAQNTLGQLLQLSELVKSTSSIATALSSGNLPGLDMLKDLLGDDLFSNYLGTFGFDFDSLGSVFGVGSWKELQQKAKEYQKLYKEGKQGYDAIRNMKMNSLVSWGTKAVKNTLFAKGLDDLTEEGKKLLEQRRNEAVKQASSSAYALAVTAQQEAANLPEEKLSTNSSDSNKAESIVTQIRNNTGTLMNIATQLNTGNLLAASHLEVLASSAISTMPREYLSPGSDGESEKNDQ